MRLLQSDDPDLTDDERARIAAEGEVVVLRWGWGPDQRELDPHVTEFRVYEAAGRLIEILARVTGPATPTGTGSWRVPCSFSRPIAAERVRRAEASCWAAAFRIVGHPAGAAIDPRSHADRPGGADPERGRFRPDPHDGRRRRPQLLGPAYPDRAADRRSCGPYRGRGL